MLSVQPMVSQLKADAARMAALVPGEKAFTTNA